MRGTFLLILFLSPMLLLAQFRYTKLTVKSKEIFQFGSSDIIVADTLVMMDSSRIVLNNGKSENFIRVKVAIFGNNCWIAGNGICGNDGRTGASGRTLLGPCKNGMPAKPGNPGADGTQGVNLFLYIDKIIVNGSLVIDLSGGNGGDGGHGGEGGGGSPGTFHCNGGNGGKGGDGGDGGNGGRGGTLTFSGLDLENIRMMVGARIIVNTLGGNLGYGGLFGDGGSAGLGPAKMDGKRGIDGRDGDRGRPGNNGIIQFEHQ